MRHSSMSRVHKVRSRNRKGQTNKANNNNQKPLPKLSVANHNIANQKVPPQLNTIGQDVSNQELSLRKCVIGHEMVGLEPLIRQTLAMQPPPTSCPSIMYGEPELLPSHNMPSSFILNQKLNSQQRHVLMSKLVERHTSFGLDQI